MTKTVFKLTPEQVATLPTADLLAAVETQGHRGHFAHLDTWHAIKSELRRRADEALFAAGAAVVEASPATNELDWEYPKAIQ